MPATYHTSISTLLLSHFITALVDDNLQALVISGEPTTEELAKAWISIQEQYTDAVGDLQDKVHLRLYKEIVLLKVDLLQIRMIIQALEQVYHPELVLRLNKLLQTNIVFDPSSPEAYLKQLQNCTNRSKGIKIDLDLKELHMKALNDKGEQKSTQKYTREYFQSILISISDYAKYQIGEEITVFQFCERIKRYNEYVHRMQKAVK